MIIACEVEAVSLDLIVSPDKQVYNIGDGGTIVINGSLTDDGSPVTDAIVAVEVDNPVGGISLLRTLNTGPLNSSQTWPLEILEIIPTDLSGTLIRNFQLGNPIGFKVKVENHAANPNNIIIMLTLVYSNQAPFETALLYNGTIDGQSTKTVMSYPVLTISRNAIQGNTTVYVNVYNLLPRDNGFAYCPEKSNWFLIGSSTASASTTPLFPLNMSLPGMPFMLGNYTIYATVKYGFSSTSSRSQFEIILVGDITGPGGYPDGLVDMRDIAFVASKFGTEEGDPGWDPLADLTGPEHLVPDGQVDMRDIAVVAKAFGLGVP